MAFGAVVWTMADDYQAWIVLGAGALAWMIIAASAWIIRKHL